MYVAILLIVFGLIFGSFINALVWRLHYKEASHGRRGVSGSKLKKTIPVKDKFSILYGRSMCPNCQHLLYPKDLIPVFSWLFLKGKCRYCRLSISAIYPLTELATAGLFVFSFYFWPLPLHGVGFFTFIVWLLSLIGLIALFIYDARWLLLPNRIIYPLIAVAVFRLAIVVIWNHHALSILLGGLSGVAIIAGTFWGLYQFSKGKWIGGGDVKLGVLLGLLVGGPSNSILLLLISSCAGTAYSLPLVLSGKASRKAQVPFGPFLIIGAIVVTLFGTSITHWYKHFYI